MFNVRLSDGTVRSHYAAASQPQADAQEHVYVHVLEQEYVGWCHFSVIEGEGIAFKMEVDACADSKNEVKYLEHVQVGCVRTCIRTG